MNQNPCELVAESWGGEAHAQHLRYRLHCLSCKEYNYVNKKIEHPKLKMHFFQPVFEKNIFGNLKEPLFPERK